MTGWERIRALTVATATTVVVALFVLPVPAQGALGDPEIAQLTVTPSTTQAGAHPDLNIFARFCNPDPTPPGPPPDPDDPAFQQQFHGCVPSQLAAHLKDFVVRLPPGLLGNPTVVPACPTHLFLSLGCSPQSVVGFSFSQGMNQIGGAINTVATPVYRVETLGLEPARLGTGGLPTTPPGPLPITIAVRTTGDYGIDSSLQDIPLVLGTVGFKVLDIDTTLCSMAPCQATPITTDPPTTVEPLPGARPFMVNPTSCDKPATVTLEVRSWETRNTPITEQNNKRQQLNPDKTFTTTRTPPYTPTGCENVPFGPNVTVDPDSTDAGAATGYKVAIQYPPYADASIWQSALRHADVTLPEGVSLAPAGGVGLEACTAAQFGVELLQDGAIRQNNDPDRCPEGSHIGDIKVDSPALPTTLGGKAFFGPTTAPGRPTPANPWKLFLLIEGHGLRIKLVGDVSVSPSGQVTTTFRNQPEVPFTRFELHTRGGDDAVLANPTSCTPHSGEATLTAYNGKSVVVNPTVTPTGCPNPQPFQPVVEDASAVPSQAGASSVSHLVISRADGHQLMKTLNLSLPPGAVGSLAAVPLCPASVVNSLAGNPATNCPESSKVGNIRTTVGSGSALLTAPGSIYIGEPIVPGDAASFVIVVPAKVGPIDLGRVVIVNRALLRPSDTGVDVLSPDIPRILEGIPLAVRRIEITVDREGFFLNPTGCDRRLFVANFTSYDGASARAEFPAQATGCDRLAFSPKLRLLAGATGLTKTNSHPPLRAIVTQGPGEANIAKARVVLPDIIRPNVPQIQKPGALCNDAQLAARACPPLSQIGDASVVTPVLPFVLRGPVYLVLKAGSPLPNLAILLRGGGFEVVLTAGNGFSGIRILNTFDSVPDVPQSRFRLSVKGGPDGILLAHSDLCKTRPLPTFDATFTGQNGKVASSKPTLETRGCSGLAAAGARVSIASRVVKVTRKRVAPIKLRCGLGDGSCAGTLSLRSAGAVRSLRLGSKAFSIRAGKSKTVKVKLTRKGFRAVVRRNRLRSRVTASVRGAKRTTRTIMLKETRKKRSRSR